MSSEHLNNAVITWREELTPELVIFRIAPDSGEIPPYEPGQYAELALPELDSRAEEERRKLLRRAYSIASAPKEKGYLEFFIVRVEGGALTPKLFSLKVGDRVWLGPKVKGKFTLALAPEGKTIVMVSTGTGLSPFVSMVKEYLDDPRFPQMVIIHGARKAADLGYRKFLEELAEKNRKLRYICSTTREPEDSPWKGLRGRVNQFLEPERFLKLTGISFEPENLQFFLCGNPAMIDELTPRLIELGCKEHSKKEPGNIHFERFW
jgi:ferredoxin--NADP+ reductase